MHILEKIVTHKRKEVAERKTLFPEKLLEKSIYFETKPLSLKHYLLREDKSGIIAEFKRKSPSKGIINAYADVAETTIGYMQAGASALSVLTDTHFFGGKNEDLTKARDANFCPILRKDFILDPYQVIEAKSIGADAILLIAAILSKEEVKSLAELARSLQLEVLMEVYEKEELEKLNPNITLVGVNNRNLKDFTVNLHHSVEIAPEIPEEMVKIAESSIETTEDIHYLREYGFQGFLIGGFFMRNSNPAMACRKFINRLKGEK